MQTHLDITQRYIIEELRDALGANEETEHLIDWLLDAWQTLEVLKVHFGEERALHILTAYAFYVLLGTQQTVKGDETCTTKPDGERNGPTDQERSEPIPSMDLQAVR